MGFEIVVCEQLFKQRWVLVGLLFVCGGGFCCFVVFFKRQTQTSTSKVREQVIIASTADNMFIVCQCF